MIDTKNLTTHQLRHLLSSKIMSQNQGHLAILFISFGYKFGLPLDADFVFDAKAAELLKTDPEIKRKFEERKQQDSKFAENQQSQLYFIYKLSPYYEKSAFRYPVIRLY